MRVKLFSSDFSFFPEFFVLSLPCSRGRLLRETEKDVVSLKVFGICLSRLETSRATPPLFLQLYFLLRLILGKKWL